MQTREEALSLVTQAAEEEAKAPIGEVFWRACDKRIRLARNAQAKFGVSLGEVMDAVMAGYG